MLVSSVALAAPRRRRPGQGGVLVAGPVPELRLRVGGGRLGLGAPRGGSAAATPTRGAGLTDDPRCEPRREGHRRDNADATNERAQDLRRHRLAVRDRAQ
jgi:hypothetical protein